MKWLLTWQGLCTALAGAIVSTIGLLKLVPKLLKNVQKFYQGTIYLFEIKEGMERIERGLINLIQGRRIIMGTDEVKAYFETDAEGSFVWTSRLWSTLTGLQPDELRGNGWESAVQESERSTVQASWEAAFSHQRAFESTLTLINQTGQKVRIRLIAWPIRDEDGRGVVLSYLGHATKEG